MSDLRTPTTITHRCELGNLVNFTGGEFQKTRHGRTPEREGPLGRVFFFGKRIFQSMDRQHMPRGERPLTLGLRIVPEVSFLRIYAQKDPRSGSRIQGSFWPCFVWAPSLSDPVSFGPNLLRAQSLQGPIAFETTTKPTGVPAQPTTEPQARSPEY